MTGRVDFHREGTVMVVTVRHPPVNALSLAVRVRLIEALDAADADDGVRAVVLTASGAVFLAGADIRELGKPWQEPLLATVCQRIEASRKPIVAALNGAALGGGFEVALAAHYRVANATAEVSLPEVLLGLLPGAGGTQRAPRLAGARVALDLMLSGRRMKAHDAMASGLIDRCVDDPLSEAIVWAASLGAAGTAPRRSRDAQGLADRIASLAAVAEARDETVKKSRGLYSPMKIIEAVDAACLQPFDAGLQLEAELFRRCLASPQKRGLVHAFFAERESVKVPEAIAAPARAVAQVGVVGGGTMGAGIAVALLDAGLRATMIERDDASLARGRGNVEKVYDDLVAKGRLSESTRAERLARFDGASSYAVLADADLVIEAVFEDMAAKQAVFAELQQVCKPGAVLATNTSYLDIAALAMTTRRPEDVIGLHFFSPANVMKLLEVVVPDTAAPDAVATGFALAKRLRKVAVRAGVCDGFIGNRMLAVYRRAAEYMVEDGASPYEVDAALREFGFPMGPFQVMDLAGGDISWATRKRRALTRDPRERYVQIADRLCERGWFGRKTGRGWYRYPQGSRSGVPDHEVLAIVEEERRRAGTKSRSFSSEEIVHRYLAAMINEGANVVQEGIAWRPLDVDVVLINGYGFPRHWGGPMNYADMQGLRHWVTKLREWMGEDAYFWQPSELLLELAQSGSCFEVLNRLDTDDPA